MKTCHEAAVDTLYRQAGNKLMSKRAFEVLVEDPGKVGADLRKALEPIEAALVEQREAIEREARLAIFWPRVIA